MAVIAVTDIDSRIFSGWADPALPTGYWLSTGTVTGDGTGGDESVQFDFAKATGQRNSQFYSLEEVTAFQVANGTLALGMLIANMDTQALGGTGIRMAVQLTADQAGFGSMLGIERSSFRGIFLGRQTAPSSAAGISFSMDNVDTVVLIVKIGGYVWSARSAAVPGGPQRPPSGLYSL